MIHLYRISYSNSIACQKTSCRRQAFLPGKLKVQEFFISQEFQSPLEQQLSGRSGQTTAGDSGGPLLAQQADGTYQIVGVAARGDGSDNSRWTTFDSALIDTITIVFARRQYHPQDQLVDLTPVTKQNLLEQSGTTWGELVAKLQSKPNVQASLGRKHSNRENALLAHQWYKKAAEQGHADAQKILNQRLPNDL